MRSVEFARTHHEPLHIRSSFTWEPGTWVTEEDPTMEQPIITAVTHDLSEAKVTVNSVPDAPGIAARLFRALADNSVNVDMIVQNVSHDGTTDISFTTPSEDAETALQVANALAGEIGAGSAVVDDQIGRVSLIGAGMKTHPGVAATMFETMAANDINIEMISTSAIRISCVVRQDQVENAVVKLHEAFKLDVA
jgi:aspartate kinase